MTLLETLSDAVGAAFAALDLPVELGAVKRSDRPDLAQFQCNGAMAAGKKLSQNPREIAAKIVAALQQNPIFAKVEAVGPGFINLSVTDAFLADHLAQQIADEKHGVPDLGAGALVMLDYGGPNAAKPMHVGHLRTAIVGDTLRRLLAFTGHKTIGDIHLGDWGLQAGMVLSELEIRHPEWPWFAPGARGPFPATLDLSFDDLSEIYPTASAASKADEARMERSRKATVDLQAGHPGYRALWQSIVDLSIAAMKKNYGELNVFFDLWEGEKDADPLIPGMVEDLKARGFAVQSEGAWVIPVARNDDKKEVPPLLLIKSDGAALYATTDLATIVKRMKAYTPARIVYVVDQRQGLHFEQVFRAARMSGIAPDSVRLDFAGIGTMNGVDGKPFKTRAGGVLKLEDLIGQGLEKARARIAEADLAADMDESEKEAVAKAVAIAAIKFADLKNPRHVDYIFDLDAMTAFEGKTGPYLLYQAVRINSILTKAADKGFTPSALQIDDTDRDLALLLAEFPEAVMGAVESLSAHVLCDYLFRLAQEFSSFYNRCHILSETDGALRGSRLALCASTLETFKTGLTLMGIDVPARM